MSVQWFPGHMTSARKKAAETMEWIDVVIEVLDARVPQASCNPMIGELRRHRQRPCLKILNKADLADPVVTAAWLDCLNHQQDVTAVALSCKKPGDVAKVTGLCQTLAPHRNDNTKPLRMMIMGIPNVGKSTLMNALLKRRLAAVGDEPAITRSQTVADIGPRMTLTDTPGMMWPKIQYPSDGLMLAVCHAIGRNAVIEEEVATFLAEVLLRRYPEAVTQRYGFPVVGLDGVAVIEAIARRRGMRMKGGALDLEKASLVLLQDFRDGRLGRISLETPATRQAMIAEYAQQGALAARAAPDATGIRPGTRGVAMTPSTPQDACVQSRIVDCTFERHASQILAIFNDAILTSTALYDYQARNMDNMVAWFETKARGGLPVIGVENAAGELLGFASYGTFRAWPAYKYSVEHSVYIRKDCRGRGLAARLMRRLVLRAREQGVHVLIGAIDAANEASIALHEKLGFTHAGTICEAGFKFGRWLDLAFYQLILDTPERPVDG